MNKLPIYKALISDEYDGITAISLVSEGAVEIDFQMFDKQQGLQTFAIQDEEEHLLLGCVMRCDFDIYRNNGGFEYFIRYDRQTIEKMATKMLKDHTFTQIDLQHDGNMLPQGMVELRELFIKDSTKGIVPNGFDDVADGSLFAVYKINSPELWDLCKQGIFNSFSLEGYFNTVEVKAQKEDKKESIMNKIKEMLCKLLTEFASVTATNGVTLYFDGEEIAVGVEVSNSNGEPIEDGNYIVEEKTIVVKDGKVTEIREKEEEVEEPKEDEEPAAEEEQFAEEEQPEAEPEPEPEPESEEPAKDYDAEIEALKAEIDALKADIEAIKNTLAEPAAEPVAEEFEKAKGNKATGNKGLERALAIAGALKN